MTVRRIRTLARLPPRERSAHKGTFGTLGIVAGSALMFGAAILCARAALRGGAGLVRVALPRGLIAPFLAAVPAATACLRTSGVPGRCSALVIGPGLGNTVRTRQVVRAALSATLRGAKPPIVFDADALNVLAPLRAPLAAPGTIVLTPHPGEAARLLGTDVAAVQADRGAAVLELQARSGQVVVLKGAGTLVTDGVHLYENLTGNPGLATAGSGDVLAGLLGALLAQGMAPLPAACLAVHVHGAAGDLVARRLSEAGLCSEDLPLAIAEVLGT